MKHQKILKSSGIRQKLTLSRVLENKEIFFAVFILAAIFVVAFFGRGKVLAFPGGWGIGIWNNTSGYDAMNNELFAGSPAIGWLSSSSGLDGPCVAGKGYGLYFTGSTSSSERDMSGKAWFGIGSQPDSAGGCQNDLPSLGWLDFGAGTPSFCAGSDCHVARWHKDGDNYTGYLDGWAKVTSMGDNGWVRLKGSNYSVRSNANGILAGFGWNSGIENALGGNSGLGWIKMDGLKAGECNLSCATKQLCREDTFPGSSCDSSFCTGGATCALGVDKVSWTCSGACGTMSCGSANINWIDTEMGVCGPLNGKSLCESGGGTPSNGDLCANNTTPHNLQRSGVVATWTCGSDLCGGKSVPCSASTRCGWIETNP